MEVKPGTLGLRSSEPPLRYTSTVHWAGSTPGDPRLEPTGVSWLPRSGARLAQELRKSYIIDFLDFIDFLGPPILLGFPRIS